MNVKMSRRRFNATSKMPLKISILSLFVDDDTQLIQQDFPDVLAYLFETYGKIPSKEVKQKEAEICTMTFHPADPMILLYNPIEQLEKMAQSAQIPYTARQILDIALTVLRNTRDFERALGNWELKPQAQKTWSNFKTHFTAAQKQLKAIGGPTIQQAGYHKVNLLAQQFKDELATCDQEIMTILKTMEVDVTTLSRRRHQTRWWGWHCRCWNSSNDDSLGLGRELIPNSLVSLGKAIPLLPCQSWIWWSCRG